MRGKIWSTVLLSSETRQGHPLLLLSFKFVPEDLSNTIKEKCEMKGMKIEKNEEKHLYLKITSFVHRKGLQFYKLSE